MITAIYTHEDTLGTMTTHSYAIEKWHRGAWRVRIDASWCFGHITRKCIGDTAATWMAEIRNKETGALVRYAGIWGRKKDAVEECLSILTDIRYKE